MRRGRLRVRRLKRLEDWGGRRVNNDMKLSNRGRREVRKQVKLEVQRRASNPSISRALE